MGAREQGSMCVQVGGIQSVFSMSGPKCVDSPPAHFTMRTVTSGLNLDQASTRHRRLLGEREVVAREQRKHAYSLLTGLCKHINPRRIAGDL